MCEVISLPPYYGPRRKRRKLAKQPAEVISLLSKPDAESLYLRAEKLDESRDTWDFAARLYREAIRLDPTHCRAMTNLGNICLRRGDDGDAGEWYDRALAINPRQPEAIYNIAFMHSERGEWELAEPMFRKAIEYDPSFADAHYNLGLALVHCHAYQEAVQSFLRYVALESSTPWAMSARRLIDECREKMALDTYSTCKHCDGHEACGWCDQQMLDEKEVWNINDPGVTPANRERLKTFLRSVK